MPMIEAVCTITAKGQTTVPKAIRQALGVSYGGRIIFRVEGDTVSLHAAPEPEADPALAPFLALLERDIASAPERLAALAPALVERMAAATEGVTVDPETPIEGDVAL
ncbi:MAG: type II toxin-antitoxin system PrlF family antitoxin [Acetobacteraceae bacterium]|nr:type II toxin-antitoxin system PrlF family antitoxin [Acetobacteraceae bacterium]